MSGSKTAPIAVVLGAVGIASIPAAIIVSQQLSGVDLLQAAEVAVVVASVLGLIAVAVTRRARFGVERTVARRGEKLVRAARILAWGSLYLAASGAIALGFYGALVLRG